jgi:hypothetical protein
VAELRARVSNDLHTLVRDLQEMTGRFGDAEAGAWTASLPKLSTALAIPALQPMHLYFEGRGQVALEYQLPASSSWCDVVLLGSNENRASAVIVELKDWATRADKPGKAEGLIERSGRQELHPSDQVRGYVEYCRHFHSAVLEHSAVVGGCVLFTRDFVTKPYTLLPNDSLVAGFPLFTMTRGDLDERLPTYLLGFLKHPDEAFAQAFSRGHYKQTRSFVCQIGAQIKDPKSRAFELLDNQRRAFVLCRVAIEEMLSNRDGGDAKRNVLIVQGPPGSGKSAIAAKLWSELVTNPALRDGDIVFTTTSLSQNSNWIHLFDQFAGRGVGAGVIRKASSYTPLSTHRVGQLRGLHGDSFLADAGRWRENLDLLRKMGEPFRDGAQDLQNLVTIVDEAHALINPEHSEGRGQFGFAPTLGPQGFHIIRSSVLTVLLVDPEQGFRHRENTRIEDLKAWSEELGAGDPEILDLTGMQFRCAGSAEYVMWLESVLMARIPRVNQVLARTWRWDSLGKRPEYLNASVIRHNDPANSALAAAQDTGSYNVTAVAFGTASKSRGPFEFELCSNPEELETMLRCKLAQGFAVRLLSTYSRPWRTRKATAPHDLPAEMQDFDEVYQVDGQTHRWARVWNVVHSGDDYSQFVLGAAGGRIAEDSLSEVGCPYAVRGFDYDYIGVLWLEDLIYREGQWRLNLDSVHESGLATLVGQARQEVACGAKGNAYALLMQKVKQAYRIVLTRALRGTYIWIADPETRKYIRESL